MSVPYDVVLENAHRLWDRLTQGNFSAAGALHDVGNPLELKDNLTNILKSNQVTARQIGIECAANDPTGVKAVQAAFVKAARALVDANPASTTAADAADISKIKAALPALVR